MRTKKIQREESIISDSGYSSPICASSPCSNISGLTENIFDEKRIHVSNIPFSFTHQHLREIFKVGF